MLPTELLPIDYQYTIICTTIGIVMIYGVIAAVLSAVVYRTESINKKIPSYKLIGLRGKFGVGKDTAADFIVKEYLKYGIKYETVPFAAPLKHITAIVTSTSDSSQYTREGKAHVPEGLEHSVGKYQQIVGQTMREVIHDNVWVRIAINHPSEYKIIPDVRHVNEVEAIEAAGGIVISITRPGVVLNDGRDTNHISETALDNYEFKHVVENTGSLDDLRVNILKLLEK